MSWSMAGKMFSVWLGSFFRYWRWGRRLAGGRWERWYVDFPVCMDSWYRVTVPEGRPSMLCRGTPTVEDYTDGPSRGGGPYR